MLENRKTMDHFDEASERLRWGTAGMAQVILREG